MLGGAGLLGAACVLASRIGSLWSLYAVVGVLAAAGLCAVSWVPSGALMARWFTERRGSMMGLAFSGMGAGVLAIGPLAQWLITSHGWRAAYLILGLGTLAVLLPLIWLGVREAPGSGGAGSRRDARPASPCRRARRAKSATRCGRARSGRSSSPISARRWPSSRW